MILFNPKDLFHDDGTLKKPDELDPHLRLALNEGRFRYTYDRDGNITGIKFSARKSAEILMRELGNSVKQSPLKHL